MLNLFIQNPVAQANVKLAMFYDWLFYSGDKDNIMNIGKPVTIALRFY